MTKTTPPIAAPAQDNGRLQAVSIAMQQIEKQFGKGSIMRLGESMAATSETPVISTGSLAVNLALGIGGFPKGRIVEILSSSHSMRR